MKNTKHVIVVGGGAAGFFAAIRCTESDHDVRLTLLEKSPSLLAKVRVSGGGRCNVTHSCFDPRELSRHYPRGSRELIGPFHRWQPRDTIAWFEKRRVKLKTESDGRMFPVTDSSQTIIDCLLDEAAKHKVTIRTERAVSKIAQRPEAGFFVTLSTGEPLECDALMLATGGLKEGGLKTALEELGHTIEPPVPSLFTLHIRDARLDGLSGITVPKATVSIPGTKLAQTGPLLITHQGISGPATLKLSAWAARYFHERNYRCAIRINWLGTTKIDQARALITSRREHHARKLATSWPELPMPARLWERLLKFAGVQSDARWGMIGKKEVNLLAEILINSEFQVSGKTMNKEEFVTCGGVRLSEVDFKTMQSKLVPGLFFGGELLDIDGVTGGFNFQAAWTTGSIAGTAMSELRTS